MTFQDDFEHRDDLIEVAVNEFVTRGYDDASINRILATAGMSKGQFYYHFGSKEDLYLALVERALALKQEWFAGHPLPVEDDFFAILEMQVLASLEFSRTHTGMDKFVTSILAERGRPIYSKLVQRFGFSQEGQLGQLVEHFHARGQFRQGLTVGFVQNLLTAVLNNLADIVDLREPAELKPKLDQITAFLRRGLAREWQP